MAANSPISFLSVILFAAYAGHVTAAPGPTITSTKLTGVVSSGEWHSPNRSETVILLENGKRQVIREKEPSQWFVILQEVDGLSEEDCILITNLFGMSYPHHAMITEAREDGKLVLVFTGDLNIPLKVGSKIVFEGLVFKSDDYGGAMTYRSISVDGKRHSASNKEE